MLENYSDIQPDELGALLNITLSAEVTIDNTENIYIAKYESDKRLSLTIREGFTAPGYDPNTLPEVDEEIVDGSYYIVREILFSYPSLGKGLYNWRCFIELTTGSILFLEVFSASATAAIFLHDPITMGNSVTGSSANAVLDLLKTTITLSNLQSPVSGNQSLKGTKAYIIDPNDDPTDPLHFPKPDPPLPPSLTPPYEGKPPTTSTPYFFDYPVRTEEFSAVSAYYYVDSFFAFVDSLGIQLTGTGGLLPNSTLPLHIDHRAFDNQIANSSSGEGGPGGTTTIGIRCGRLVTPTPLTDYLGIGTSFRMLLHELGHCLSYDHFHSANLPFSHGFGDSLAALINDPYSSAPDLGLTFPWIASVPYNSGGWQNMDIRRNDYYLNMAAGWYWGGSKDDQSYKTESILASTFYKIYRALGGDSTNQSRKITASRMLVMLLLKTLKTYTPTNAPQSGAMLANGMWACDATVSAGDLPNQVDNIRIGTSNKVIRWGFEKMAAYDPVGSTYPPPLTPSEYDIYIDDGRNGEYEPYLLNFWSTTDIVNRNQADSIFIHQNPTPSSTNYLYIRVKNRGTLALTDIEALAYRSAPGGGNVWPQDWTLVNSTPATLSSLAVNADDIMGPIAWTAPSIFEHVCIMAIVRSIGDVPNTFFGPTLTVSIPDWYLVPNDNNIAQRNMPFLDATAGSSQVPDLIAAMPFLVKNPYHTPIRVSLEVQLPELLVNNKWTLTFDTGDSFDVDDFDREGILVTPTLEPGDAFTQQDVLDTDDRNIVVTINSGLGIIGGMTYYLNPDR